MAVFLTGLATIWWLFPASLGMCITACTLAMEGAVLFAPAFLLIFPLVSTAFPTLDANEAIGVALFIGFFGSGSASIGYLRQGVVDMGLAVRLLVISVPLTIIARLVAFQIPSKILFIMFGLVLFVLAYIVLKSYLTHNRISEAGITPIGGGSEDASNELGNETELIARDGRRYRYSYHLGWLDRLYTAAAGTLVGLIGVGVGEIVNTNLMVRHNLPMRVATGTAVIVVTATVLTGSIAHLAVVFAEGSEVAFEWSIVALAAPAVLIGGQIAPHVSARFSENTLKKALMFMFVLTGTLMIIRGVV